MLRVLFHQFSHGNWEKQVELTGKLGNNFRFYEKIDKEELKIFRNLRKSRNVRIQEIVEISCYGNVQIVG